MAERVAGWITLVFIQVHFWGVYFPQMAGSQVGVQDGPRPRKLCVLWLFPTGAGQGGGTEVVFFSFFLSFFNLAALGLSCGMRDLVPWPGMEPGPPALGAQSLNHWTTREVPWGCLLMAKPWPPCYIRYCQFIPIHTLPCKDPSAGTWWRDVTQVMSQHHPSLSRA